MNCLLAAATPFEIAPFIQHCREHRNAAGVDILITGIGLTATTYAVARQLSLKKPDLILQAGVAGSFDHKLPLGTVVVIAKDSIADQCVIENKALKTMFDLGLIKKDHPPFRNGWLVNPYIELIRQTRLRRGIAVSVNQVTTSPKMIERYQDKFDPVIESMEGAALHYAALMENIPFLQIRSISNYVGERNKTKWKMKEAIFSLNRDIIRIMNNFSALNS